MKKIWISILLASASLNCGAAQAQTPKKFSWCAVSLIGKEARISSIFLADEGRGSDALADRLGALTGTRPSRHFLCKQFVTDKDAKDGLATTVRSMKAAGYEPVQLDLNSGAIRAL